MTETEKQEFRDRKAYVVHWLQTINLDLFDRQLTLGGQDKRLRRYVRQCINHPDDHNIYELEQLVRFFMMMDIYDLNVTEVLAFVRFAESMSPEGTTKGNRLRLTPIEIYFAALLFGFWDEHGVRMTRIAYLMVPRKFGKTLFCALLMVYDLLCGEPLSEAYVAANSSQQAKICFRMAKRLLRSVPALRRLFKYNREEIRFKNEMISGSRAECLSANGKTKDGMSPTLAIIDEFAAARNTKTLNGADLKAVLISGMGARKQPMCVVITTASEVLDGPFIEELKGVKQILDNILNKPL